MAIRLRRFLITEPTTTLAHFSSLVRGVWAHTTYVVLAYPPPREGRNPRRISGGLHPHKGLAEILVNRLLRNPE